MLCAIELSHCGLLERELMEMLGVESHVWLPLYFAMEGLLVSHAGLLRSAESNIFLHHLTALWLSHIRSFALIQLALSGVMVESHQKLCLDTAGTVWGYG